VTSGGIDSIGFWKRIFTPAKSQALSQKRPALAGDHGPVERPFFLMGLIEKKPPLAGILKIYKVFIRRI